MLFFLCTALEVLHKCWLWSFFFIPLKTLCNFPFDFFLTQSLSETMLLSFQVFFPGNYFKFNSIFVKEYILCDVNSLKFVKRCFMAQNSPHLTEVTFLPQNIRIHVVYKCTWRAPGWFSG